MKLFLSSLVIVAATMMTTASARKLVQVGPDVPVSSNHEYIVIFGDQTVPNATAKVEQLGLDSVWNSSGVEVTRTYNSVLKGMAIRRANGQVLDLLELDSQVQSIEPNVVGTMASFYGTIRATQAKATKVDWGLDRIDEKYLPLDGKYNPRLNGTGVRVFVLDSGMRLTHSEFGKRARCGFDATTQYSPNECKDMANHGTLVAGIVGGKTYGVAKRVSLVSVKVSNSTAFKTTNAIAGMDYILNQKLKHPKVPMVAVMSGNVPRFSHAAPTPSPAPTTTRSPTTSPSFDIDEYMFQEASALDRATEKLIAANITVVIAAGNFNKDACYYAPNMVDGVLTVGATNNQDQKSSISNHGPCVDIYAPGRNITSASADGGDATSAVVTGTSFAAPFVAGVAARLLSYNSRLTPQQIGEAIRLGSTVSNDKKLPLLTLVEATSNDSCPFTGKLRKFMCPQK